MTKEFIHITRVDDPRLRMFVSLSDAQLTRADHEKEGIFIAESPKVISSALDAGYTPVALLAEEKHLVGDAQPIVDRLSEDVPIYTGARDVLRTITGYTLTRGVLCAMRRPTLPSPEEIVRHASRIAVLDGVCDTTNIGSIFRAAAALGVDGILLTPTTCDPLNRRAVRVSMGTVFKIKWAWLHEPVSSLGCYGFKTLAMALKADSIPLDSPVLANEERLALVLGTEGDGLSHEVIMDCDYSVIIPMRNDVDSLNVASAAAVAFWQLCPKSSSISK